LPVANLKGILKKSVLWTFLTRSRSVWPRWAAIIAYLTLALLVLVWEAWWAPATPLPRAFWIALKVVPLIVPLPWLPRGSAYAHALASLLLLVYFCDGVALAYGTPGSNPGGLAYAVGEILLTVVFIATATLYARLTFRTQMPRSDAGTES
jgi:uncharacterized membrane protein